ncbi:hypothetical protein FNV43_RR27364 [Rhamnella rubrinervis]|uniref:Uncharacterized protein n=1 Tax=Rhamnella rubrinervis TaxID=2594499 RepID=A0A8K0GNF2_9ROSA|nr:hypothetical protein FNV43_RR27364 [Rhamnella rubrinervis]
MVPNSSPDGTHLIADSPSRSKMDRLFMQVQPRSSEKFGPLFLRGSTIPKTVLTSFLSGSDLASLIVRPSCMIQPHSYMIELISRRSHCIPIRSNLFSILYNLSSTPIPFAGRPISILYGSTSFLCGLTSLIYGPPLQIRFRARSPMVHLLLGSDFIPAMVHHHPGEVRPYSRSGPALLRDPPLQDGRSFSCKVHPAPVLSSLARASARPPSASSNLIPQGPTSSTCASTSHAKSSSL